MSQSESGLKSESSESVNFIEKSNLNLIEFCVWFESQVLLLDHLELNHHLHHILISQVFWLQFVHLFVHARFSICKCIMNVVRSMKHEFFRFISMHRVTVTFPYLQRMLLKRPKSKLNMSLDFFNVLSNLKRLNLWWTLLAFLKK